MTGVLREALRVGGSLALAVVLGSGIAAATGLPASSNAGVGAGTTAALAPTADPGEGAVAGRVAVSAVTVKLSIATRGSRRRPITEATVTVTNLMRTKLGSAVVSLTVDSAGVVIRPTALRTLKAIGAGRSGTVAWTLCSPVPGEVRVVAQATVNGLTTSSAPVTIRLPASAGC